MEYQVKQETAAHAREQGIGNRKQNHAEAAEVDTLHQDVNRTKEQLEA